MLLGQSTEMGFLRLYGNFANRKKKSGGSWCWADNPINNTAVIKKTHQRLKSIYFLVMLLVIPSSKFVWLVLYYYFYFSSFSGWLAYFQIKYFTVGQPSFLNFSIKLLEPFGDQTIITNKNDACGYSFLSGIPAFWNLKWNMRSWASEPLGHHNSRVQYIVNLSVSISMY